jgi:amino acid transporter
VVSAGGIDLVNTLALVTVVLLLAIYALVIVACLKLRGQDEDEGTYRANTPLLVLGLIGNLAILGFSIYDDPSSLIWCAGLIAIGVVLFLIEYAFGTRNRPTGTRRGDPEAASRTEV